MKAKTMELFDYDRLATDIKAKRHEQEGQTFQRIGLRALSKQSGITLATMHRVINGKPMDLITAIRICRWLGKKVDDYVS